MAAPIPADPLEALRGPYVRNITTIRANRDARASTIIRSYVATVERLQREAATRGDLDGAMQMKAEGERVKGGQDPTITERRAMPTSLSAARSRYEAEREPIFSASRQQEAEQTRGYLAAFDALQKRLTTLNLLPKEDPSVTLRQERRNGPYEIGVHDQDPQNAAKRANEFVGTLQTTLDQPTGKRFKILERSEPPIRPNRITLFGK